MHAFFFAYARMALYIQRAPTKLRRSFKDNIQKMFGLTSKFLKHDSCHFIKKAAAKIVFKKTNVIKKFC